MVPLLYVNLNLQGKQSTQHARLSELATEVRLSRPGFRLSGRVPNGLKPASQWSNGQIRNSCKDLLPFGRSDHLPGQSVVFPVP